MEPNPPLLAMRGIWKSFPGVRALRGVDLEVRAGEVLALLGENGAGKSTLIKVLAGAHLPDEGVILVNGRPAHIRNPIDARRAGVAVIYQELNLVPALTVRENVFLGREATRFGFLRSQSEARQTRVLIERVGSEIDPETPCRRLTVAQQQLVEICKALSQEARVIVMDEPSAALSLTEVRRLFTVIKDLKARGLGVVYISHRLDEIFEVADRVTVLRDGEHVATLGLGDTSREKLIELMVGRRIDQEFPRRSSVVGEVRLAVRGLSREPAVRDVSFSLRRGEVVGLTGLVGAGRTEMARLIFGADSLDAGTIELDGKPLSIRNPRDAIRAGIGLLTEDRKGQGLVLGQSVRENFGLPNLDRFSRKGGVRRGLERAAFLHHVKTLGIKVPHTEQLARNLSGGNQQKVVLAKWLERNCDVIIFDEPTRGIDVGAKYEVYLLINQLAASGKAILMISSELPEVLGMSDRVLVMRGGRIAGEITEVAKATQEQIMAMSVDSRDTNHEN